MPSSFASFHQIPPLVRKNFLVWFASPRLLSTMLISAFIAFVLIPRAFVTYNTMATNGNSSDDEPNPDPDPSPTLFSPNSYDLGPWGLCDYFSKPTSLVLYTTPGLLADQIQFNLDSLQFSVSNLFRLIILPSENDIDLIFDPSSSTSNMYSIALTWSEKSQKTNTHTNSSLHNRQESVSFIPNYTNGMFNSTINYLPKNDPDNGEGTNFVHSFDYDLLSRSDGFKDNMYGKWIDSSYMQMYNRYDNDYNRFFEFNLTPPIHALIEFTIAQLNGFYPTLPMCSFQPHSFNLKVYPYPASYTTPLSELAHSNNPITSPLVIFLIYFVFLLPIPIFVVTSALSEKVSHLDASLLMIGITSFNMHLATLLTYLILFTPLIVLGGALAIVETGMTSGVFFFFFFYAIITSFVTFSRLVASLFTNLPTAQIGSVVSIVLLFAFGLLSLSSELNFFQILLYSLFTTSTVSTFNSWSWLYYRLGRTLHSEDIFAQAYTTHTAPGFSLLLLFGQSAIMLFLGAYFDSIFQTSLYHVPKPWYFPISDLFMNIARLARCQSFFEQSIHALSFPNPSPISAISSPSTTPFPTPFPTPFNSHSNSPNTPLSVSQLSINSPIDQSISSSPSSLSDAYNSFSASSHSTSSLIPSNSFNIFNLDDNGNKPNPFDVMSKIQQRYFLQYGNDKNDRLYPEEEYLFEGTNNFTSSEKQEKQFDIHSHNAFDHSLRHKPNTNQGSIFESVSSGFYTFFSSTTHTQPQTQPQTQYGTTPLLQNIHTETMHSDKIFLDNNVALNSDHTSHSTKFPPKMPIIQPPTPSELDNPSITLKNITKSFDSSFFGSEKESANALNGINLRLYRGEINSIIGRNASGKSVLLSILGGMIEPTEGSVFFHLPNPTSFSSSLSGGHLSSSSFKLQQRYRTPLEEMQENPLGQYRQNKLRSTEESKQGSGKDLYRPTIGFCWQEDTLFEDLTCIQNLELFSMFKESVSGHHLTRDQRFQEIFQFLDMAQLSRKFDNKEDAKVSSLSGGQRRKLNLAIALLHNPQIVLLDHCTNGADVSAQAVIWKMLELQKKQRTIVLATHNFAEALIGDRISIIKEGELACSGSALFLKDHYHVGEYIFTIDKQPFISLSDQLFEHDFAKKAPPQQANLTNQTGLLAPSDDSFSNLSSLPPSSSQGLADDEQMPNLFVDLHQELMSTSIEHIGFNLHFMLRLISDSNNSLSYAIQPGHESNIPLLLDYLEINKDRLWVRATSLTTTSLDDVFRRAHDEEKIDSSNCNAPQNPQSSFDQNFDENDSNVDLQNNYQLKQSSVQIFQSTPIVSTTQSLQPPKPYNNTKDSTPSNFHFAPPDIDPTIQLIDLSQDIFANNEWYSTKLPKIESKFRFFPILLRAFLKKRISMLFYHFTSALPIFLAFLATVEIPIIFYFQLASGSTRIPINFEEIQQNGGRLQYFTPLSDNTNINYQQPNYFSHNFENSAPFFLATHTSSDSIISSATILHNWLSQSISSPDADSSSTQTPFPYFYQALNSPFSTQQFLLEQSYTATRLHPYALSTIVHSADVLYNNSHHRLFGEATFVEPQLPSGFELSNALIGFRASIYINMTSPLIISGFVSNYYPALATLHVNLQKSIKPITPPPSSHQFKHQLQQVHQQGSEFTPLISTLKPLYKNTASISTSPSALIRVVAPSTLSIIAFDYLALLCVIISMFLTYTHHQDRNSKVYELHRLAGGSLATIAYHLANIFFDIIVCICLLISAYSIVIVCSRAILMYRQVSVVFFVTLSDLPVALLNSFIYISVAAASIPFQSYLVLNLSPNSLTSAYIVTIAYSLFPLLLVIIVPSFMEPTQKSMFLPLSPTALFIFSSFTFQFDLWSYGRIKFPILTFNPHNLLPFFTILLGIISIIVTSVDWKPSVFNKLTGSLRPFASFHQFRPYTHVKKCDPSVAEMKRNIFSLSSRTGLQGKDQFSIILHGVRKVFPKAPRFFFFRFCSFVFDYFNPFLYWWRNSSRFGNSNSEHRKLEEYKLRLLRRQQRSERRIAADRNKQTSENSSHYQNDQLQSESSDDDEYFFGIDDLFISKPKSMDGTTVALNELFLSVRKNSVMVLVGGNGQGKSTLFTILTNELIPSSSSDPMSTHTAFIGNSNILTDPSGVFSRVAYCPQANRLNLELTAREHFKLYATLYGIESSFHSSLIHRVLYALELFEVADSPCSKYSPGQLRLVMIGISLLGNAEITLLDEISNLLDPITRGNIHTLLKKLVHTRTIILASHMAEEIESLADDIAILSKGSLVTVGSKSILKTGGDSTDELAHLSLVYTVHVRVESPQVLISVQSFVLSTLSRIPPPKLDTSNNIASSSSTIKKKFTKSQYQEQLALWTAWLQKCQYGGVHLVDQRPDRFTLHVSTDLLSLSTLFTRLENCKAQCGSHLVRYTASQPTIDQLFLSAVERSKKIISDDPDQIDRGQHVVI